MWNFLPLFSAHTVDRSQGQWIGQLAGAKSYHQQDHTAKNDNDVTPQKPLSKANYIMEHTRYMPLPPLHCSFRNSSSPKSLSQWPHQANGLFHGSFGVCSITRLCCLNFSQATHQVQCVAPKTQGRATGQPCALTIPLKPKP